ncbi:MAG: hypothetical protein DI539_31865 [Flavobacterium psychrophilum]|nr:MAG: hypothetical protein DI539_31865 [Flavobacterium psychrophilum]
MAMIGICEEKNKKIQRAALITSDLEFNTFLYPFAPLPEKYVTIAGASCLISGKNLVDYIIQLIIKMGVKIHEGVAILDTTLHKDGILLTPLLGLPIMASYVLRATGNSMINQLQEKGFHSYIKKVVALHIDHPVSLNDPVICFLDDDAFLLPQPQYNRYLFSFYCNDCNTNPIQASTINNVDIEAGKQVLDKFTADYSTKIIGAQVYLDVYNTPSSSPITSRYSNYGILVGSSGGSGVRLAPALAIKALSMLKL